jgi:hypothetical protein
VGSPSVAPKGRTLHPVLAANRWKPGQSGNPSGNSGEYGDAMRLARQAAPSAVLRLVELIHSDDERVAAVACNAILDRAFGKPREHHEREVDKFDRMTREELEQDIAKQMTAMGWVKLAAVEGTDE